MLLTAGPARTDPSCPSQVCTYRLSYQGGLTAKIWLLINCPSIRDHNPMQYHTVQLFLQFPAILGTVFSEQSHTFQNFCILKQQYTNFLGSSEIYCLLHTSGCKSVCVFELAFILSDDLSNKVIWAEGMINHFGPQTEMMARSILSDYFSQQRNELV